MALRNIVHLGFPTLRQTAEPVDLAQVSDPEFQQLIDDMIETMHDADGVGLAAPQIGLSRQLFVYLHFDDSGDSEEKALLNPAIEPEKGNMVEDWEGCLSIPDLHGLVPRHPAVWVHGHDRHGNVVRYRADGLNARILQHEFDHLNGIVFLDRMRDLRSLSYTEEWTELVRGGETEANSA